MVSSKQEVQRRPPSTRRAVVVAQDPSIRRGDAVLTVEIDIPAEKIAAGPAGARVRVVDYDASSNLLFTRASIPEPADTSLLVLPAAPADLLADPHAHATNVYAIVMRILSRFEFALGRRVAWGFPGHHKTDVAPTMTGRPQRPLRVKSGAWKRMSDKRQQRT